MPHTNQHAAQPRKPITNRRYYWCMVDHDIKVCRAEFNSTHERAQALLRAALAAGVTQ